MTTGVQKFTSYERMALWEEHSQLCYHCRNRIKFDDMITSPGCSNCRHQPELIGLQLDAEGWALVAELVARSTAAGHALTERDVVAAVGGGAKRRYELSGDGQSVRAIQGHSTNQVQRKLEIVRPPPLLFHGTATRFLPSIRADGLMPGGRHHVHLSLERAAALEVGKRHGRPVVLAVNAHEMQAAGYAFHRVENGVWLTTKVPVEFLVFET
jgi:putative RNA 2'-phosphotransferase